MIDSIVSRCIVAFAVSAYVLAIGLVLLALTTDTRIKTITVKLNEPPAGYTIIGGCAWDYDKDCWYLL